VPSLSQIDPTDVDASFLEPVARAACQLQLTQSTTRVFDCLRDLRCLAHWWPGARDIVSLPPGLYGAGDVAVLKLRQENVVVLVLAYKPGSRIVLALRKPRSRLLLDLRVRCAAAGTLLDLVIETPRAPSFLAQTVRQLRLRLLCREAAARIERHLRTSLAPGNLSHGGDVMHE